MVNLDVNQMLVRQLLDVLVVDVQQNLDELILDAVLTLVDVRPDEVGVVQVGAALSCFQNHHQIQKDYFRHVAVVALLVKRMQLVLLARQV